MIAWLWNLIVGQFCRHQWEIEGKIEVYEHSSSSMLCGTKWILRCTKCGDMKRRRL